MSLGVYTVSKDHKIEFSVAFDVMGYHQFRFILIESLLGTAKRDEVEDAESTVELGSTMFVRAMRQARKTKAIKRHKDMTDQDEADLLAFAKHKDKDGPFTREETVRFKRILQLCRKRCIRQLTKKHLNTVYDRLIKAFTDAVDKEGLVLFSLTPLGDQADNTSSSSDDDDDTNS
jgi:hypothetical protein